jgi:DHA3 family macrolide efflux protein-like MFS transporter
MVLVNPFTSKFAYIRHPQGMMAFVIVWTGQVASLIGTAMSQFALTVWAWKLSGSAMTLSVLAFCGFAPTIVLMPLAGIFVDRWDRKVTMAVSDAASGLATLAVLVLYGTGRLQVWHLYLTSLFSASFQAFQWPAYSAAISTILPRQHYARASGMLSLAQSASGIAGPAIAGVLVASVGLPIVLIIDIVTCVVAVGVLFFVRIPRPSPSAEGAETRGAWWRQAVFGFRYIFARPPLLSLMMLFIVFNLLAMLCHGVWSALLLARSGGSATVLGVTESASAVGFGLGGLLLVVWSGPRRKMTGILWAMVAASVVGSVLVGLGRSVPVWAVAGFIGSMAMPVMNGLSQSIWQCKVPADVQGRVFSARMQLSQVITPLAMLASGAMADHVFEPAMMSGGRLTGLFAPLVGSGRGAGMAVMFVVFGALGTAAAVAGFFIPQLRHAEQLLPDAALSDAACSTAQ